ncbi:MAG: hypothetical protein KFB95_05510 [Simkaniaceae bacterium]|nr:MAG: hypothetical protein KFB95_05510 [Simkaniaceae bacterium]
MQDNPEAYQYERAKKFGVTQNGIWHAMKRLHVTYKKLSIIQRQTQKSDLSFAKKLMN